MIGEIRKILTPYYDNKTNHKGIKSRPGLIIAQSDGKEFVVLPVSKVTSQQWIDPEYDIKVDPTEYPMLSLNCVSYIRTHKQTAIHIAEIGDKISDMKSECEDLYLEALTKLAKFNEEIISQAMQ